MKKCLLCGKKIVNKNKNAKYCCLYCCQKHWSKKNPEKIREKMRRYREKNLELCRKRTRENQRILNNKKRFGGNRLAVLERDNYICFGCKKDVSGKNMATIHHLDHNKKNNNIGNLVTYCKSCHSLYHYKQGNYKIQGCKY
jgi:5-methylcytosine-specific restriction endonuclease McrA